MFARYKVLIASLTRSSKRPRKPHSSAGLHKLLVKVAGNEFNSKYGVTNSTTKISRQSPQVLLGRVSI